MNDDAKAALLSMGAFGGAVVTGSALDHVLPWNLGMMVSLIVGVASIGFVNRWYLSADHWSQNTGFADVHLYLRRRQFITATHGRWYVPQGIGSKLFNMLACGGMYTWEDGDMHLNLPSIVAGAQKDKEWIDGVNPDTVDEAVAFVIEHEAIHSAIHSCSGEIYTAIRDQFRSRFQQAGLLGKIRLFLESLPYVHRTIGGNEEWAVETLQRRIRELHTTAEGGRH